MSILIAGTHTNVNELEKVSAREARFGALFQWRADLTWTFITKDSPSCSTHIHWLEAFFIFYFVFPIEHPIIQRPTEAMNVEIDSLANYKN